MRRAFATFAIVLAMLAILLRATSALAGPGVVTKPPKLVTFVEATYPAEEKAAGRTASVVMKISIGADGKVVDAIVTESAGPAFDAAALTAAKQFVFEPAEIDGVKAPVRIDYRYAFTLAVEIPKTAIFSGRILRRDRKEPLAGVKIELDDGRTGVTDADGRFRFEGIEPGVHKITLSGTALTTVQTEEVFEASKRVDASYEVDVQPAGETDPADADDLEIVVVAPPLVKDVTSVEISEAEGRRVPGTQGDVLKVVQNLPGVNRAAAGSGQIVVWGAAPEDTRVYVEGVRVPLLYHYGGVRSVLHSDLVRSVELVPGGYGAGFGRGLGGLVTVRLLELEPEAIHGSVSMDLLDISATTRVGVGTGFRAAVGARYGWLDRLVPAVTDEDVGELFPVPQYFDAQARVAYYFAPRTRLEIGGFGSRDRVERVVDHPDPDRRRTDERSLQWGRVYARFDTQTDDGAEVSITPSFGLDRTEEAQRFGALVTTIADDSIAFGLRGHYRARVIPERKEMLSGLVVTVGVDGEGRRAAVRRNGSIGAPRREGDQSVFGEPPSDQIASDDWVAWVGSPAIFAEADLSLFSGALQIVPGLRAEPTFTSASRSTPVVGETPAIGRFQQEIFLEPRLAARVRPSSRLELRAAYGLYHQPPDPRDLSPVFGNPALESSSAHHVLGGFKVDFIPGLSADVVGFFTKSSDLAARSPSPSPLLTKALVQRAEGRAYGVQLLLRKELADGFFGWLSYALSRSERADGPNDRYRLSDYDQTHVLTALASYEIGWGIEVGARVRVASGFPRTPVVGSYFDARTDTYRPIFGDTNTTRLPLFFQLDARVSKRFDLGDVEIETYVDVQNVPNYENVEEIVYSADYSTQGAITGIPILPVIGVRSSW